MATRRTNEAVTLYRKISKKEIELEQLGEDLKAILDGLDPEEFEEYYRLTDKIDDAVASYQARAHMWTRSTKRNRLAMILNQAGQDVS